MIEVNGLTRYYADFSAISDVSFSVEQGEIIGLLGLKVRQPRDQPARCEGGDRADPDGARAREPVHLESDRVRHGLSVL